KLKRNLWLSNILLRTAEPAPSVPKITSAVMVVSFFELKSLKVAEAFSKSTSSQAWLKIILTLGIFSASSNKSIFNPGREMELMYSSFLPLNAVRAIRDRSTLSLWNVRRLGLLCANRGVFQPRLLRSRAVPFAKRVSFHRDQRR